MLFEEIILILGIEKYPDELKKIYESGKGVLKFDGKILDELDSEFSILGNAKEDLKLCEVAVKQNHALREYTRIAVSYLESASHEEGGKLALPELGNEYPLCFYSALLLALAMPTAIKKYRHRGFPDNEIKDILSAFKKKINSTDKKGINLRSYNWLRHYTSAVIFKTSLFGITPEILKAPLMLLKNQRGEYKMLMTKGRFHRSGKILGSAGYTDDTGAFDAVFSEDKNFYIGQEVINATVLKECSHLSKNEWTVVTKQGDGIAGIHIPTGSELTDEKMNKSFREAFEKMSERYPDFNPKTLHCSSWLLEPKLADILGPKSRITGFVNRFLKYPIKSSGKELFGFAFPRQFESYESLPEDTSLQRKLKTIYMNGEFIHAHGGFVSDIDY